MRLDLYMKHHDNSNEYELFDTEYVKYDTHNLNLDKIRIFLINLFNNRFENNEYQIKIHSNNIYLKNKPILQTVVSVFFEHDKEIKRDFRIKKVLQND